MTESGTERKEHPEWFNEKGQLDITKPEARDWLKSLFEMLVDDWGYEYINYDFVSFDLFGEWGPKLFDERVVRDELHDETMTNIQAFREALRLFREATNGKSLLMACNSLMAPTLGLADAYRIGDDVGDWPRTFKYGVKSIPARYYTNGVYWANDPDCLIVREPFTLEQAEMWASLVALSGGVVFISEKVYALPSERLEIMKKILPVYHNGGESFAFGRPIDLLEKLTPEVWNLKIEKEFGSWNVIGLFNWSEERVEKIIPFLSLDLEPDTSYLLYDFWRDEFLGQAKNSLRIELPPLSARVLAIHTVVLHPQILSTSRHITQGGVELKDLQWDNDAHTLSGVCHVIRNNPYQLSIHVPQGFRRAQIVAAEKIESGRAGVLKLMFSSQETGDVSWSVTFEVVNLGR